MTAWKVATVVVIGASAAAVVLFEILHAATSLFNHGNHRERPLIDPPVAGMPNHASDVDRILRWMLMLPFRSMHARAPFDRRIRQEAA